MAKRVLLIVLVVVGVSVAAAALVGASGIGIVASLRDGRSSLGEARRALIAGRIDDAARAFDEARSSFRTASDRADSLLSDVARSIPVLGRTTRVLAAAADAGERIAGAGVGLTTSLNTLPGGLDALAPTDGALPVEALPSLASALADAHTDVAAAAAGLRASPSGWLPGPVAEARRRAIAQTSELERALGSASDLAEALPAFAGSGAPRRYLLFAEDPAELRGTGGLWGAYSIVQARLGRFTFSPFRPVQTLPTLPVGRVDPPNPDYERNYRQYGAPGYWLSTNMTPDFPSAARAAIAMWEETDGRPIDGVITADPFALHELLVVTGPVRLGSPPLSLTADDVVTLLTNRAFSRFSDSAERKAILGDAARAVLDRFLALDGRVAPRLRALARATADGHLKIFSTDATMESALVEAGLDGGLPRTGDVAGVVVNAGAGAKVDFFATRTIRYDVTLLPGGAASATTTVAIDNEAPTSGQPRYVIGPWVGNAGDNIPLVTVLCGGSCDLVGAERDGQEVSVRSGSELDTTFFRDYFTIPSKRERELVLRTRTSGAWTDRRSEGTYTLTVIGQTTIRPTQAVIEVHAPTGMRFVTDGEAIAVDGDRATWRGVLGDRLRLELALERKPLVVRLWEALFG
jgi:hypothetical protein